MSTIRLLTGTLVTLIGPAAVDCSVLRVELRPGETVRGRVVSDERAPLSIGEPPMVLVDFDGHGLGDIDARKLLAEVATPVVAAVPVDPVAAFAETLTAALADPTLRDAAVDVVRLAGFRVEPIAD